MLIAKMGAYYITGSAAIFSDAIESIVHIAATSMALYSIILSSKPADSTHLYGHSNVEYFSAGIEGLLIIFAAIAILYNAVLDIIKGQNLQQLDIGVIIISAAGIINLFLGLFLIKRGKQTNSLTLIADGKHVLTDSYTSIGVVVGIVLVMITGYTIVDPLFAIAVALNILFTGYKLTRDAIGGLMHETDLEMLEEITSVLQKTKQNFWIDLHELRFWKSGEFVFIDFHLTIPFYFTVQQSHSEETRIYDEMKKVLPTVQIKIHFDACFKDLCSHCEYLPCDKRQSENTNFFKWNSDKMIGKPILINPEDRI